MSADRARVMLICRVGECVLALPLEHVAETMRVSPIEAQAQVLPFVLGLSLIRGEPTPVLSGAKLLGVPGAEAKRLVLLRVDQRQVALAVDEVIGLRPAAELGSGLLPPLVEAAAQETITAIGVHDGRLLVVLEGAKLVSRGEA